MRDELREEMKPYLDSELVPLEEKAVRDDGIFRMKIIQPGWGSSGYYPPEVLAKDGPRVFKAGTQMYLDHPTESEGRERPERSVRDLAGVTLTDAVYEENGQDGPGLYADAKVLSPYRETVDALAPHIGVSIRAHGAFEPGEAEGRKGKRITRLTSAESIDFVTKPGAGGKVLALMESLRESCRSTEGESSETAESDAAESAAPAQNQENDVELKEAQDRIAVLEGELQEKGNALTEAVNERDAQKDRADRAELKLAVGECKAVAAESLKGIELPDAAKDRIVESIAKNPPLKEGALDADAVKAAAEDAAKSEAAYLESVLPGDKVKDQGKPAAKSDESLKEAAVKRFMRVFGMDEATAVKAVEGR